MSEKINGPVIGIDLGTTNSCASILEGGKPIVIVNAEGLRTTPSVVAFKNVNGKTERSVGAIAKRQSVTNSKDTLYRTKSFIGLNFDDLKKDFIKNIPYEIIKGSNGAVEFKTTFGEKTDPVQIGSAVLQTLVEDASRYLGKAVKNVVITVPAYFNDSQRQATKDAGMIAGLNVLRIINEPTAAALAYGLDKIKGKENIAVYDLGGGTFDISILSIEDGVFEVLSTNGDTQLGGEGFDSKIMSHIMEKFKMETGISLTNPDAIQRLKEASEKAKIELSSRQEAEINLPFITADANGAKHLNMKITRAEFERMVSVELEKTIDCCKRAIEDSKLKISDINRVLLVGGSTRIPKVTDIVTKVFGKAPSCDLNPDEVVAMGAAVQGGILTGDIKDILLLDVIPLTLGIETLGGVLTPLVERNSTVPTKKTQMFSTAADNQTSVSIRVFQGERKMAEDNKLLGNFDLHGIPSAQKGVPQIEVTFDVDANGILSVSAKEKQTGIEQKIVISNSSNLSKEEIEMARKKAEEFAEADNKKYELIEIRNKADNLLYTAEKSLKETKDLPEELKNSIEGKMTTLKSKMELEEKSEIQSSYDDLSSELSKIYEHVSKNPSNSSNGSSENGGTDGGTDGSNPEN